MKLTVTPIPGRKTLRIRAYQGRISASLDITISGDAESDADLLKRAKRTARRDVRARIAAGQQQ